MTDLPNKFFLNTTGVLYTGRWQVPYSTYLLKDFELLQTNENLHLELEESYINQLPISSYRTYLPVISRYCTILYQTNAEIMKLQQIHFKLLSCRHKTFCIMHFL